MEPLEDAGFAEDWCGYVFLQSCVFVNMLWRAPEEMTL